MDVKTQFLNVILVLPSADIARDLKWYEQKAGFKTLFNHGDMYAPITREHLEILP